MGILGGKFRDSDVVSLKSQLKIEFPLEIADIALKNKWNDLSNEYGIGETNALCIILEKTGKIARVNDNKCADCWARLFDYLRSLK